MNLTNAMGTMVKLGAGLLALLCGVGVADAGVNEPDYFVTWAGSETTQQGPYINTGYVFKKMPLVEAGVANLTCGDSDFMGTDLAQAGCFVVDICNNGTSYRYYRYGTSSGSFSASVSSISSLNTSTFNDVVWSREIWHNGTKMGVGAASTDSTFSGNTRPFYFFKGRNTFGGTAKVSYLRMYNGTNKTELVRSFRPGVKNGVIGFYDSVEDKFYTNAGSGSFQCGPRASETDTVVIDSNWLKFGTPDPDYGRVSGLAAGEERVFTAPTGICESGDRNAVCKGWNLYSYNSDTGEFNTTPYLTGDGTTCHYTHPDPAGYIRLEWIWVSDASRATTLQSGEWDDPAVWSSLAVPTKDTVVTIAHGIHCSSNVHAKSMLIQSGGAVRFHASTSQSIYQATPDAPGEGSFTFRIEGDLTLAGGALALHGGRTTPVITNLNLVVGGDLTLSNAAVMTVAAAAYDGACCDLTNLYNTATRLRIGGALTVTNTATLYAVCDQKVGSPVRIDCTNFTLGASAKISADERGWHWLEGTADGRRKFTAIQRSKYTFAHGPGLDSSRIGGGNGGCGSNSSATTEPAYGATYGNAFAPFAPGSPSGGDSNYSLNYGATSGQCRGGGVVWIFTTGAATIDGRISATAPQVGWQAGSGGSVWLAAKTFSFGAKAMIDVSGGDAGSSTPTAAGGGGRVSFAEDVPEAVLAAVARGEHPSGYLYKSEQSLTTCVDISGGSSTASDPAESGTATYLTPAAATHDVTVTGNPMEIGVVKPDYGVNNFEEGAVEAFSAAEYGYDQNRSTWRRRCLGYVLSNATEQIDAKSDLSCDLTIGTTDLKFVWQWDEWECVNYLVLHGPGHFQIEGQTYAESTNVFLKTTDQNVLTAVPDAGCEFLGWTGDVSDSERFNATITLTASNQPCVTGVFRRKGAAATQVWKANATGDFYDGANWEDGVAPGELDTAVVTSGVCKLSEYVTLRTLQVGGTGKVVTGRTASGGHYKANELLLSGDLVLTNSAVLQLGALDGSSTMYNTLSVGGAVTLWGGSKLYVAAGRRTGSYTWDTGSGFVTIGGSFRLNDSSVYYPNCDGYYGGCVQATVGGAVFVASNAQINANARGMGNYNNLGWNTGVGDGQNGYAAAHFGWGAYNGTQTAYNGSTYDNAYVPLMPGQQNRESVSAARCRGGGVIRIFSAGPMRIDGTLTANGTACEGGNSSGGTIWLVSADHVRFGAEAVLSVQGGYSSSWPNLGAGGGGCVSICEGFTSEMLTWLKSHKSNPLGPYKADEKPPRRIRDLSAKLLEEHPSFEDAPAPGSAARDSAKCWGSFRALTGCPRGFSIIVR